MMLKSFWTSHLQMMNKLEPLFYYGTGRWKNIPKDVDETTYMNVPAAPLLFMLCPALQASHQFRTAPVPGSLRCPAAVRTPHAPRRCCPHCPVIRLHQKLFRIQQTEMQSIFGKAREAVQWSIHRNSIRKWPVLGGKKK